MNREQLIELLEAIYCYAEDDDEAQKIAAYADNPTPDIRQDLIVWRDTALAQGVMDWALALSHAVYATTDPAFWQGETVALSTL